MKRNISERDQYENLTMANCLMFLSRSSGDHNFEYSSPSPSSSVSPSRVFECKTCNRQFPSFQALGGHRASHKKPRLAVGPDSSSDGSGGSPAKPKTHECTICGLEFAIGQALGGHMRRHRATMTDHHHQPHIVQPHHPLFITNISNSINIANSNNLQVPAVKKIANNGAARRVLCLDLNLTPLENDIKILQLANPLVNIF